jgi:hypothetical protein
LGDSSGTPAAEASGGALQSLGGAGGSGGSGASAASLDGPSKSPSQLELASGQFGQLGVFGQLGTSGAWTSDALAARGVHGA